MANPVRSRVPSPLRPSGPQLHHDLSFALLALLAVACGSSKSSDSPTPSPTPTPTPTAQGISCPGAAGDLVAGAPDLPIQYVFVLMQENRSFDHYYGRFKAYLKDVVQVPAGDPRLAPFDPKTNRGGVDVPGTPYELRDCDGQIAQDKVLGPAYDPRSDAPFNPKAASAYPKDALEKIYWRHAEPGGLEQCISDTCHEWWCSHLAWNSGRMDGFYQANDGYYEGAEPRVGKSLLAGDRALFYHDQRDIPFYYWLAEQFTLGDRYFASLLGPTWPNRDYLYAATSRGVTVNSRTDLGPLLAGDVDPLPKVRTGSHGKPVNTIYDALDEKKVRYGHWVRRRYEARAAKWGTWYGKTAIADILSGTTHDYDPNPSANEAGFEAAVAREDQLLRESLDDPKLPRGALPQVSFIDPDYLEDVNAEDEHPPGVPQMGQRHVYDVVRVLLSNREVWKRSVLFITYDEGGGFYDHVDPPPACPPDDRLPTWAGFYPTVDQAYGGVFDRLGFRVPLLVVSPWAVRHHVSHVTADHSSILRFIEAKFRLPALTRRDANADPLLAMFEFGDAKAKLAGDAFNADGTSWGDEALPGAFPVGPGATVAADAVRWFGGPPGEKRRMTANAACVGAMPPAGVSPTALGADVFGLFDWSPGVVPPPGYKPDVSQPFPRSASNVVATGAAASTARSARATSCPITPPASTLRIKVITTFSQDPNDFLADKLYGVHVTIGGTRFEVPDTDDVARGAISPGPQLIKFPKDNGLDDDKGKHLYRVGSINVHVTKEGNSGLRCKPVDQEGDVTFTFDPASANPTSQSEYEVGIRIVPFDAPALQNGVDCR